MQHLRRALTLTLGLSLLGGCLNVTPPGTVFASDPPGARVDIDGKDSGWVTPCQIDLNGTEARRVTISLPGYAPREVLLEPAFRRSMVSWYQGVNGVRSTLRFPLFLPTEDLLLPLRPDYSLSQQQVFVRLHLESAP